MEETNNQTVDTETTEITEEVKETKSEKVKEEKTFTQKDFDEALQKEISRKTKGIPSKEELKALKNGKITKNRGRKKCRKRKRISKNRGRKRQFSKRKSFIKKRCQSR